MKTILKIAAAAAILAAPGAPALAETLQERGEARLARMIEGHVAGEPRSCIAAFRSNKLEVIEQVGLVYDAGDTVWVARAAHPRSLGRDDVPVIERHTSQLCHNDVIRTIDRSTGFTTGAVFLDRFVPYTKTRGG